MGSLRMLFTVKVLLNYSQASINVAEEMAGVSSLKQSNCLSQNSEKLFLFVFQFSGWLRVMSCLMTLNGKLLRLEM